MAVNRVPVLKRCRSLGLDPIYLGIDKKSTRQLKRANRKVSEYGLQLKEKQKAKFIYGVLEKPFRNYYKKADRMKGQTGENLMIMLETRLDNVLFRMGFARTRKEARQIVDHKHVLVNGKCVNIPSYLVKAGDSIEIKEKCKGSERYKGILEVTGGRLVPNWLEADQENLKGVVLLDVTPLSMGIETMGGVMTKLIEANTTIPCKKSETFSTAADNQTEVTIHVLQGERPMAAQNKSIGQFNLTGIAPARRGIPQIEVTFDIDANGILKVSAKDKATGKEQAIRIEASSGLSKEEIEKMKAEAEANAEADKKEREKVDKLNQADSMIFQTENQLKELGDKLPADKKAPIEAALQKLKDAHKAQDLATVDSAMAELNTAFQAASAEMYAQSGAQGGAQAGPDMNAGQQGGAQDNTKHGDNVQDADFEEVK